MGTKHSCLPFPSEAQYCAYVDNPAQYRQYLTQMLHQYPELFPKAMHQGFTFHDCSMSVKRDLIVRRSRDSGAGGGRLSYAAFAFGIPNGLPAI